jgi:putative hydrolase of the HAD superfamily
MNVEVKPELLKTATQKRISTREIIFNTINLNIINMLKELKNEGYKLGLISNCDSNEITVFRSCELYNLFDAVVLSCDERLLKPDKEIYCLCVERLKVLPGDCLYIGDGGSNELDGAINAGMKTAQAVWFIKVFRDNYINSEGYDVLQSPEEVLKYLKMIWN